MKMNREIYIHERFWAAVEDGALMEYIPRDDSESAGEIVLGKAERLMAGMNSAFVDIGRKRSGFLPLQEAKSSLKLPGSAIMPIRSMGGMASRAPQDGQIRSASASVPSRKRA